MKKISRMDEIAEFYIRQGKTGYELRKALENDKEYARLLKSRQSMLSKRAMASTNEKRKYVLSVDRDFEILRRCKALEKGKLSKTDSETVKLVKTQLEEDWRKPLIRMLNTLEKKYRK